MTESHSAAAPSGERNWFARIIGIVLALIGLWMTIGGAWLIWLGGSAYYLIAGIACLAADASRGRISRRPISTPPSTLPMWSTSRSSSPSSQSSKST